uniref:Uncharacterized protein n=1 Tax=Anguilla anguilla TaxID=7936 RepID=A0A0E9SDS8_ANGAN
MQRDGQRCRRWSALETQRWYSWYCRDGTTSKPPQPWEGCLSCCPKSVSLRIFTWK